MRKISIKEEIEEIISIHKDSKLIILRVKNLTLDQLDKMKKAIREIGLVSPRFMIVDASVFIEVI